MEELLKLLEEYMKETNQPLMSFRIFPNYSGVILGTTGDTVFNFKNKEELKVYFSINSKRKMNFFGTLVEITDRHIEPKLEKIEDERRLSPKYEEITMKVRLVGNGDTTKFTSQEIAGIVMDRLQEIKPI